MRSTTCRRSRCRDTSRRLRDGPRRRRSRRAGHGRETSGSPRTRTSSSRGHRTRGSRRGRRALDARVAALLDRAGHHRQRPGGIGRPIERDRVDGALFAAHGVRVIGAVVSKVDVDRIRTCRRSSSAASASTVSSSWPASRTRSSSPTRRSRGWSPHRPRRGRVHRRGDAGPDRSARLRSARCSDPRLSSSCATGRS